MSVASARLVGREPELARVDAFLDRAATGHAALELEGEPGMGKTMLWRAAVERAHDRGFRVLQARPAEAERELSFAALGDLVSAVSGDVGALPAPQRRALRVALLLEEAWGSPPDERSIGTALLGLLGLAGAGLPTMVAVDDVQWLDGATRSALQFAPRRSAAPVILAWRLGSAAIELDEAEVIEVAPLGVRELDAILRARLGVSFLRPTLLEIERASGGNPFFALELGRALAALPRLPAAGEPFPVPKGLGDLVRDRLAALPARAQELVVLVAALAQPTVSLLEAAIGDLATTERALSRALREQVLELEGERVRFTHPLLAAVAYSGVGPGRRRALNVDCRRWSRTQRSGRAISRSPRRFPTPRSPRRWTMGPSALTGVAPSTSLRAWWSARSS